MIVIVNYQETHPVKLITTLKNLGLEVFVSDDPEVISASDYLLLPNVKEYQSAMKWITEQGLKAVIKAYHQSGKPILGVGTGMHLLFEGLTGETFVPGLGLLEGLSEVLPTDQDFPLPHQKEAPLIGIAEGCLITEKLDQQLVVYDHQLTVDCELEEIRALSQYSLKFPAIIQKENIVGFQFLAEENQVGHQALSNFIHYYA